jgi:flagellar FliJ protein
MKRFRFRLQRVLEVRERIRDEKRQELVQKNFERDQAIQRLEDLRAAALGVGVEPGGTYPASHMLMLADYAFRLKAEIGGQITRVEEAMKAAEEARERYVEASKDTKALEMLKQKRTDEYKEMVLKEDGNNLDELAVQRGKRHRNQD